MYKTKKKNKQIQSKIILGTVQLGINYGINNLNGQPSEEEAFKILKIAQKFGIDELDTADGYGSAATVLKNYLNEHPSSFKVMSKFSCKIQNDFLGLFQESLRYLGLSKLEGYYFHNFRDFENFADFDKVHKLKEEGILSSLAVSIYSIDELGIAAVHPEVDVIQLPFNLLDRDSRKIELLEKAKSYNKKIYTRSVFLQGLFFLNVSRLPSNLRPLKSSLIKINQLALKNKMSMHELCLNYVLHKKFIDKVIIGVDSAHQLNENLNSIHSDFSGELENEIENIVVKNIDLLNPGNWSKG
jgi:aryl-alcohol dehydrogenase-like predicted oxidoreductase